MLTHTYNNSNYYQIIASSWSLYNIVRTLFLLVQAPIDDQYRDQLQRLVSKTVHSPLPQLLSCGQIANYFPGPLSPCLSLAINNAVTRVVTRTSVTEKVY